jgi:hypothetical protein
MTELDLLNVARAATVNEMSWFGQLITMNFAMVVAIYYFLNQARIALKIFSFVAYIIGTLVFFGQMLIETNIKFAAITALKALPASSVTPPTRQYIAVLESWLGVTTSVVFNSAFWILGAGVFYLLFFWRKATHEAIGFRP